MESFRLSINHYLFNKTLLVSWILGNLTLALIDNRLRQRHYIHIILGCCRALVCFAYSMYLP